MREPDPSENIEQYIGNVVQEARLAKARAKVPGEDWSQTFLARRVFTSQSRISEVETGDAPPDTSLARKLESVLGLRPLELVNLVKILDQATYVGYAKPFLRRQQEAAMIHACGHIVPGLLQTADYTRELILTANAGTPEQVDRTIEQRRARQAVWERQDPPWMSVVLAESALYGATEPQLARLMETYGSPNITLRILPSRAGHIVGTMSILTLPNGTRGAYTEGFNTGSYSEEVSQVLWYQKVYDRLAARALAVEESATATQKALKRFHE
ncbi:helix-turn-helix transcriptional regulator [Streptomyces sp. NBC_00237]|uniref:helix-turn-helix domain-containing protein n=1 Tax=Streptomyces sp. NBC_00237 TaxID=2975687 RepID=UPI00224E7614|nr:helix-turn-helix transcriptional regulator [Streptomyces sp. NBC_00237]MCX5200328.1 helix-turn-helix transcriptional regulator [Streptomyces sp. NBC_00237]